MKIRFLIILSLCLAFAHNAFSQDNGSADNALIEACRNNKYDDVRTLLPQVAGTVNFSDAEGYTALMYASDNGNDSIIQLLLEYGANPNQESFFKDAVPAITNTVLQNSPRTLDLMLQFHGNPNLVDSLNHLTLLHYAVKYGYLECAEVLLFHGANPSQTSLVSRWNYDDGAPQNPLQMAVSYHDTIMAQLLIDNGADINAKPGKITPLCIAISKNDYSTADYLLRHGADVSEPSSYGAPILYSAVYADSKMSQLLINHGAKLDATDPRGNNLATVSMLYNKAENRKLFESQGVKNNIFLVPSAFTLSYAHEFCNNEYRMAFRAGIVESHLNMLVYAGVSFRPGYKTAYLPRGEKSYWQLREKITLLQLGVEKRFSFFHQRRPDLGAYVGYQFSYGGGKYDGSIEESPETQALHSPSVGIYQRFSGIGISSGYRYYSFKKTFSAPNHVAEINLTIYFNFYRHQSLMRYYD
ncbi:MAG: ankyrin repeat domain-containing protein [Bacteroidales bacterium]|nr:ankyrin repeat domain-containing protein [Bacteroidales bacterium]